MAERIVQRISSERPVCVTIDGAGGAGKTTLAAELAGELESANVSVAVLHLDDFWRPHARRSEAAALAAAPGTDLDAARLHREALGPLMAGRSVRFQRYDWAANALADWVELPASSVVLLEGVMASSTQVGAHAALSVWVEAPRDVRLARGLARDGEASRERWEREWMPAEERYIAEQRPDRRADVTLEGV